MPKRLWMVGLPSLLAAACSSSPVTQPPLAPCTATSGGQVPRPLRAPPRAPALVTPVDSGNVRTFKVCNTLACDPRKPTTLSTVTATALKVGAHIAIYVDNAAPQPGLSQTDLDNLRAVFDTRLYETDTRAFGSESDIDNNGKVIVLMSGKVNSLVTSAQCTSPTGGFVAGFFFGADLVTTPPVAPPD